MIMAKAGGSDALYAGTRVPCKPMRTRGDFLVAILEKLILDGAAQGGDDLRGIWNRRARDVAYPRWLGERHGDFDASRAQIASIDEGQAEATAHRIRDAFDARAFEHHTERAPRVAKGFGGPRPIEASVVKYDER